MAISDFFQNAPNYINPDYATPSQIAQARTYAQFLGEPGKGQIPVKSWQAGLANALNSGLAGWELGKANRAEQLAYARALDATTRTVGQQLDQGPTAPVGAVQPGGPMADAAPNPANAPASAPQAPSTALAMAPVEGTPNARVNDAFASVNSAIKSGDIDTIGAANLGPDGLSPSPYKVASLSPTAPPSPAPSPAAAATAAPAAPLPLPAGAAPMRLAQSRPDPRVIAEVLMNPYADKSAKDYASGLITPHAKDDVYGRPGVETVASGLRAQPVGPGFQPGVRTPVQAGDVTTTQFNTPPGAPARSPVSAIPGGGAGVSGLQPLVDFSRNNAVQKTQEVARAAGGGGAQGDVIKGDIAMANDAPNILKGVGVIEDNIKQFGDKITFGPTSEWSLNMKRIAANYAPGFMKDQLDAIAGADSIHKVSIGLAGALAGQLSGGSNADTFARSLQGVPGLTTSKEGALAMADMVRQAALKQQQLGQLLNDTKNWSNYPALKAQFFAQHPIINPLTGHPIQMDVEAAKKTGETGGGRARIISVEPAR